MSTNIDTSLGDADEPGAGPADDGAGDPVTGAGAPPKALSGRRRTFMRLLRRKEAVVSAIFLLLLTFVAIAGQRLGTHPPEQQDLRAVLAFPSKAHWLGTDSLGRDIYSRMISATRVALLASLEAVAVAAVIGIPVGLFVGYRGGWWDRVVMRIVEGIVSIPGIVLAVSVMTIIGAGLTNAMLAIGIVYAMSFLRLTRGAVLAAREELFVDASRVIGTSDLSIMFRHILPNISAPLIVQATLAFGAALLSEAGLSFLGLGVQPPQASWGSMLSDSSTYIGRNWFIALPPGFAIALTVLAFNLLGDAVRDSIGRGIESGQLRRALVQGRAAKPADTASDAADLAEASVDDGVGDAGEPARTGTLVGAGGADVITVSRVGDRAEPDVATAAIVPTLDVRDLEIAFRNPRGGSTVAVSGVTFHIDPGETLGLVGESGCGKSATALGVVGLLPGSASVSAERVVLAGHDVATMSARDLRRVRGNDVGVVFQDPMTSLNPAYTIGTQLREAMQLHRDLSKSAATTRGLELLDLVRITNPRNVMTSYPHELSGGMAQRVMIAMALSCDPALLIADEPTTALDVTVQSQVIDLLHDVQTEFGTSILFITHDLGVVADMCDRAAVMYAGELVETADVSTLFRSPQHPYTIGLLESRPNREARGGRLPTIPGVVPPPGQWPAGCRFQPRCGHAVDACGARQHLDAVAGAHLVRCHRADDFAVPVGLGAASSHSTATSTESAEG